MPTSKRPRLSGLILLPLTLVAVFASVLAGAETPVVVAVAKDGNAEWMQKHAANVAVAKAGNVPLLFLGDSITERWGAAGKEIWDATFAPQHAANFGISADKVENVLWRVEHGEFDGITPKVVVLMIGINNCWSAKRGEWDQRGREIAAGTKQIIDLIRAKSPRTKILLTAILPMESGMDPSAAAANAVTATFADGKTVRMLDIRAKLAGADGHVSKKLLPDGLHPGSAGYRIWAEALTPVLAEMMRE
jgi:lysophospholipase L1-like esterase